jgi:uncharacterized protein YndB with AHSA1/START domain
MMPQPEGRRAIQRVAAHVRLGKSTRDRPGWLRECRMAYFEFATIWRLDAPIDPVYALIDNPTDWPRWWPAVLDVRELAPANPDGVGAAFAAKMKGRLPYALTFEAVSTRREPPHRLELSASGELEGTGTWALSEANRGTTVRYDWKVRTTAPWMNLLAPLPFVDPIFRLNHHSVMRNGLAGIRRELGVAGSYERLD